MPRWLALAVLGSLVACRGLLGIEPATKVDDAAMPPTPANEAGVDAGCVDKDCPAGDECTQYACMSGACQAVYAPERKACSSGKLCDGHGKCVDCNLGRQGMQRRFGASTHLQRRGPVAEQRVPK